MWSTYFNWVLGFIMVITLIFTWGDMEQIAKSPTGYPFMAVFMNTTHSKAGTTVLTLMMILPLTGAVAACMATASRQIWAFARDNGVPYSNVIRHVCSRTKSFKGFDDELILVTDLPEVEHPIERHSDLARGRCAVDYAQHRFDRRSQRHLGFRRKYWRITPMTETYMANIFPFGRPLPCSVPTSFASAAWFSSDYEANTCLLDSGHLASGVRISNMSRFKKNADLVPNRNLYQHRCPLLAGTDFHLHPIPEYDSHERRGHELCLSAVRLHGYIRDRLLHRDRQEGVHFAKGSGKERSPQRGNVKTIECTEWLSYILILTSEHVVWKY